MPAPRCDPEIVRYTAWIGIFLVSKYSGPTKANRQGTRELFLKSDLLFTGEVLCCVIEEGDRHGAVLLEAEVDCFEVAEGWTKSSANPASTVLRRCSSCDRRPDCPDASKHNAGWPPRVSLSTGLEAYA